jgi:hypothetical protein
VANPYEHHVTFSGERPPFALELLDVQGTTASQGFASLHF